MDDPSQLINMAARRPLFFMQAVIIAAGRGVRMGELTKNTPKSLLKINGKLIIEYTFASLPAGVDEVLIVVKYLGDQIGDYLIKNQHSNCKIIKQSNLSGTAGALWSAKKFLKTGKKFLVLNGDDIYDRSELQILTDRSISMGVARCLLPGPNFFTIDLDGDGNIMGYRSPTEAESKSEIIVATGAYVLDDRIFKYKPVVMSNGECGLPQTIFKMASDYKVKAVFMKKWLPVNTPENLKEAEEKLKHGGVA